MPIVRVAEPRVADVSMERELFGLAARAHLMDVLQEDGVRIALPVGDSDVDMLASVESRHCACPAVWVPVKVVAACADELPGIFQAATPSSLLIALVWDNGDPNTVRTFAFTPAEVDVVKRSVFDGNDRAIEPYAMAPGRWRRKLITMLANDSAAR